MRKMAAKITKQRKVAGVKWDKAGTEQRREHAGSKLMGRDQAGEEEEPEGGEGYGRLSADKHLQAWHYQLQIPVILSH